MRGLRQRELVMAIVTTLVMLLLWEGVVRAFNVPRFLVPAPTAVWNEFSTRLDLYAQHTWATLYVTSVGFGLASILGLLAAIAIVYSPVLQSVIYPIILVLQIVPKVAIAPLLLIWLGYGFQSKMTIALLVAFFPIVVNAATGMRAADPELIDLVRVLKGSRWQEFIKIRLPYSLPFLFSGFKVAITLAIIGAIIGEFVGGNEGLGYLIVIANAELRTTMSFAALILLSLMGLVLFGLIVAIERVVIPWAVTEEEEIPVGM